MTSSELRCSWIGSGLHRRVRPLPNSASLLVPFLREKVGFIVVLTFMERECSCWDRGYEIAFYCMKVEAVQREMCGKFGLNPLDPFRPDSVQSGSTAKSINDLFFLQRPFRPR